MNDPVDLRLEAFLAPPDRARDEAFAARIGRLVAAEERMRTARRAAWTRFAASMLATASLLPLFVLLARLGGADSPAKVSPFSPAGAGLLLLALWLIVAATLSEGRNRS